MIFTYKNWITTLTLSSEVSFFKDLYANDVLFKFKDLFVIQQNPFFEDIVIYTAYYKKDYYLLDIDSNFPFLSRPERIIFGNTENYLKSSPSEEKFMFLHSSIDQGLKVEEITKNQFYDLSLNSMKRNSFIIPKSLFNKINTDVENSILACSDFILGYDNEGTLHLKIISESELKKPSIIFLKGNKFILRCRDSNKSRAIFNYLNDITESIIKPQLTNFRLITIELLQNLLIPLNKDILLNTILFDEPLQPYLEKIVSNITETLFKDRKYNVKKFDDEPSKVILVFYLEGTDSELISLYNKAQDLLISELNILTLNKTNKEILNNLINIDVVPYDSKLYG